MAGKRAWDVAAHLRGRAFLWSLKSKSGCVDCGWNGHPAALDFDHIDPKTKRHGVGRLTKRPQELILREVAKCVIRCANCHRIKTFEEGAGAKAPGHARNCTVGSDDSHPLLPFAAALLEPNELVIHGD